jgi:hypothetical protein
LITDEDGKANIGQLNNINSVGIDAKDEKSANNNGNYRNENDGEFKFSYSENFKPICEERDEWTISEDMHFVEGERIEIPINFDDQN